MLINHLSSYDSNNSPDSLESTVLDLTYHLYNVLPNPPYFIILPCPNYSLWLVVMIILHTVSAPLSLPLFTVFASGPLNLSPRMEKDLFTHLLQVFNYL